MTEKEIKKWWEETSKNYQEKSKIGTSSAHYGPFAPDEKRLKLLGNVKGKKILELGCGGGQCSIAFAKQGAKCTGIDISKEQLKFAENLAKKNKVNVNFIQGSFQDLKKIKPNSHDIVFSAFALQYSPDLEKALKQVYRILRKRGLFVFSFDHPFYSVLDPKTMKVINNYNKAGKLIEISEWDGKKHKFVAYLRKISEIYDAILNSGLSLERIIEPYDKKAEKAWRADFWKKIYPVSLCKLVTPTIIFKTRKRV